MYNSILDDLQRDYSWYSSVLDDLQREYLFFRGSIYCTVHTCIWCLRECSLYCTHLGDLLQDVYYVVFWNPYFLLHLNINSSKIAYCVLHIFFLWSSQKRMYHSLSCFPRFSCWQTEVINAGLHVHCSCFIPAVLW